MPLRFLVSPRESQSWDPEVLLGFVSSVPASADEVLSDARAAGWGVSQSPRAPGTQGHRKGPAQDHKWKTHEGYECWTPVPTWYSRGVPLPLPVCPMGRAP